MRARTRSACVFSSRDSGASGRSRFGTACDITTDGSRRFGNRLALALAALPLTLHLAALTNYDFFRDELYFIVCGRHPAFGYVDQPPLIPLLAAATQGAGESLWLLRILATLAHVAAVLAACALARELGGGRGAEVIAGLTTGTAPVLLGITATLGTSTFEPLLWTLVVAAAHRAIRRSEPGWWIVAGSVAGIALEVKYTIAFLLAALLLGLAIAGPRRTFAQREFWTGVVLAGAIAAPSVAWQALHGWPFLELLAAGAAGKNVVLAPIPWIGDQIMIVNPAFAPIWIAGIAGLLSARYDRFLGVTTLLVFLAFIALHAKSYYAAGLYPLLFAAGGVTMERLVRIVSVRTWYAVAATLVALILAPLSLPILPEPEFIAYARTLGAVLHVSQSESEHHRPALLPQYFADMHGWRDLADRVRAAERTLSSAERSGAAVFAQNYGEAAAVDIFGNGDLPVICAHNSYYLWGPHGNHPTVVIIGGDRASAERVFRNVRRVQTVATPYAMPYENNLPIFIARDPKVNLMHLWPSLKHYD